MHRPSNWLLLLTVGLALACGGGESTTTSSGVSTPAATAISASSSADLPAAWQAMGASANGGKLTTGSATILVLAYDSGTCGDHATAFAAPLVADGWKQTYSDADDERATVMLAKGDATIAVSASKDGTGVQLAVALTGTPPASNGAPAATAAATTPAAPAATTPPDAPAAKAKPAASALPECWRLTATCKEKSDSRSQDCWFGCNGDEGCRDACAETNRVERLDCDRPSKPCQ